MENDKKTTFSSSKIQKSSEILETFWKVMFFEKYNLWINKLLTHKFKFFSKSQIINILKISHKIFCFNILLLSWWNKIIFLSKSEVFRKLKIIKNRSNFIIFTESFLSNLFLFISNFFQVLRTFKYLFSSELENCDNSYQIHTKFSRISELFSVKSPIISIKHHKTYRKLKKKLPYKISQLYFPFSLSGREERRKKTWKYSSCEILKIGACHIGQTHKKTSSSHLCVTFHGEKRKNFRENSLLNQWP